MRRSHQFEESQIEAERIYHEERELRGLIEKNNTLQVDRYAMNIIVVFWLIILGSFIILGSLFGKLGSITQ